MCLTYSFGNGPKKTVFSKWCIRGPFDETESNCYALNTEEYIQNI